MSMANPLSSSNARVRSVSVAVRDLGDGAARLAHEMPVVVVGPVVHGGVAVEQQGAEEPELGQQLQRPVHRRAVRPGCGALDDGQDVGRGEVVLPGVEDRRQHGAAAPG